MTIQTTSARQRVVVGASRSKNLGPISKDIADRELHAKACKFILSQYILVSGSPGLLEQLIVLFTRRHCAFHAVGGQRDKYLKFPTVTMHGIDVHFTEVRSGMAYILLLSGMSQKYHTMSQSISIRNHHCNTLKM